MNTVRTLRHAARGRTFGKSRVGVLAAVVVVFVVAVLLAARGCEGASEGEQPAAVERGSADAPAASAAERPAAAPRAGRERAEPAAGGDAAAPGSSRTRSMTVRVRGADGRPVAGARVVLQTLGVASSWIHGATGPDGAARIDRAPRPPLIVRWAPPEDADNTVRGGARVVRTFDDLDVTLVRVVPLAGHVVDPEGAAVVAVRLRAEPADARPMDLRWLGTSATSLVPDGRFSIPLPAGRWWISVEPQFRADDAAVARFGPFDAGRDDVRIVLDGRSHDAGPEGGRVSGTARWPDGKPAIGWVWFVRDADPGETIVRTPHIAVKDGTFRSPALIRGRRYDVVLRDDRSGRNGYGWAVAADVPAGVDGIALVAQPARQVAGRVADAEDRPVEGVALAATLRPGTTIDPFDITTKTDAAGRFAFAAVPPFRIRIVAGGVGNDWVAPDPPFVPEGATDEVFVRVVSTIAVEGRVVFEDGTLVPSGQIRAAGRTADVGKDGAFRVERLVPGRVEFEWTPAPELDLEPLPLGPVDVPSTDVRLTVRLQR